MKKNISLRIILSYLLLVLIAIAVIYPSFWVIMTSFREGTSLYSESIIPKNMTLDHYREIFANDDVSPVLTWYGNTLKVATLSMLFGTIIQLFTAYTISRFRFKGRRVVMSSILLLSMFPGFLSLVAIYAMFQRFDLLGTHAALIIVYSAGAALGMFVAKGYFDTMPRGLEEAARIDGASHMTVFLKIFLPLSKPMLIYIALTTFTGAFVDFVLAKAILRNDREVWTLAVGLYDMVFSSKDAKYTLFAAGAVLAAIPVTLLFLALQRFLVEGITAGSSKG
ncbi:sugar ABC transporter permease [Longirhabdus pacifica]|uniref:sugar ABC transporter permease n=1 Tax=Longirhabdus pacifica TaxID=2305227 RepID=UPI00100927D8|nr:sugar ABC transporter permease [Longirhabdus pacifica]